MDRSWSHAGSVVSRFRACWRPLALADLAAKAAAFVLLTPLAAALFRLLLAWSGREMLADQDILIALLSPAGLACAVLIGGMLVAIVALEQAALMAVLYAQEGGRQPDVVAALRFALAHAWPVLRLSARMIGGTLLAVAPFAAALGLTYLTLLAEYDINFYLKERPPAFWAAAGLGGVATAAMSAVLLRLVTGWLYALPLVLFEDVSPARALRVSRERARGRRRALLARILGWALVVAAVSAAATSMTVWAARAVVPRAVESAALLSLAIGAALFVWVLINLAINLFGATTFSVVLFTLYRRSADAADVDPSRLARFERASPGDRVILTRRRLARWAVIGLLASFGVGAFAVHTARLEDAVLVVAHRGASKAAPENTMAAFRQAIADGAGWIELDVQETADGDVVVFHDSDFMRPAGVSTKIWDARMADLERIDIGSWFSPAFASERVPTLAAVLDLCKGKVGVVIELKYYGHDHQLEERVAGLVDARGMASQVAVMSLELDQVRKMKSLRPDWTVGLLLSASAGDLRASGADFLAVNAAFADRHFVRSAQRRGTKVYVWTVNDASTMSAMIGRGVDGLITDKPALAKAVLAERAAMSPAQRLLIELGGILGVKPDIQGL